MSQTDSEVVAEVINDLYELEHDLKDREPVAARRVSMTRGKLESDIPDLETNE